MPQPRTRLSLQTWLTALRSPWRYNSPVISCTVHIVLLSGNNIAAAPKDPICSADHVLYTTLHAQESAPHCVIDPLRLCLVQQRLHGQVWHLVCMLCVSCQMSQVATPSTCCSSMFDSSVSCLGSAMQLHVAVVPFGRAPCKFRSSFCVVGPLLLLCDSDLGSSN